MIRVIKDVYFAICGRHDPTYLHVGFRASGDIVRAAIKDFEAASLDGKLHVEILNKGFVTADFYVSIRIKYQSS